MGRINSTETQGAEDLQTLMEENLSVTRVTIFRRILNFGAAELETKHFQ